MAPRPNSFNTMPTQTQSENETTPLLEKDSTNRKGYHSRSKGNNYDLNDDEDDRREEDILGGEEEEEEEEDDGKQENRHQHHHGCTLFSFKLSMLWFRLWSLLLMGFHKRNHTRNDDLECKRQALIKAWKYFEYVTLPRKKKKAERRKKTRTTGTVSGRTGSSEDYGETTQKELFSMSSPSFSTSSPPPSLSSSSTTLYSSWYTTYNELSEFGTGVGVYFMTLRYLTIMCCVAFVLYLPTISYYNSDMYYNYGYGNGGNDSKNNSGSVNGQSDGSSMFASGSGGSDNDGTFYLLRGSWSCPHTEYVPCPSCLDGHPDVRTTTIAVTGHKEGTSTEQQQLIFALHNACSPLRWMDHSSHNYIGANHLVVMVFVAGCIFYMGYYYQSSLELYLDELQLTAQDYTVQINNPPSDAYNCDEWRDYFTNQVLSSPQDGDSHDKSSCYNNKVAMITIALDNTKLLDLLVKRRVILRKFMAMMAMNCDMDDAVTRGDTLEESKSASAVRPSKLVVPLRLPRMEEIPTTLQTKHLKLYEKLLQLDTQCREMMTTTTSSRGGSGNNNDGRSPSPLFPVSAVFVTFEKEKYQREVLQKLRVGRLASSTASMVPSDGSSSIPPHLLFRSKSCGGGVVLDVFEAPEPSTIRWGDLDESFCTKFLQRAITWLITTGIIVAGFMVVKWSFQRPNGDVNTAAVIVAVLNAVVPHVFKLINTLESHQSENTYQTSLYWKMTMFRWVNTAVVTIMITPFLNFINVDPDDDGSNHNVSLINKVHAILRAEIIIGPTIRMLDIVGNIKRILIAPIVALRSSTKNTGGSNAFLQPYFTGSKQNLGEKYTNATKTIFLVVFYSMIFPVGFLYGACALYVTYVTDKFLLVRSWAKLPELGNDVAKFSRRIFFPFCVVTLSVMSQFFVSSYPYDNLCPVTTIAPTKNGATTIRVTEESPYRGTHSLNTTSVKELTVSVGDTIYKYCDQDFESHMGALLNLNFTELVRSFSNSRQPSEGKENENGGFSLSSMWIHADDSDDIWMFGDQQSMTLVFGVLTTGIVVLFIFCIVGAHVQDAKSEVLGGFVSNCCEKDCVLLVLGCSEQLCSYMWGQNEQL